MKSLIIALYTLTNVKKRIKSLLAIVSRLVTNNEIIKYKVLLKLIFDR